MADHEAESLRSFEAFSETMNNFSPFTRIATKRTRSHLLRELYQAAKDKKQMEQMSTIQHEMVSELRAKRRRTRNAIRLLNEALQSVKEARVSHSDDLQACEGKTNAIDWGFAPFTFAEMERNLLFSVEYLKSLVAIDAASIAPRLRNDAEKRLARENMSAFDGVPEGASEKNLPSGEKARALDAWFINFAAKCIDRHEPVEARLTKEEKYNAFISRLYEAAFEHETRSSASVEKALKGRRKMEPQYSPNLTLKAFFPSEQFIRELNAICPARE
jgi:hypothetical protein